LVRPSAICEFGFKQRLQVLYLAHQGADLRTAVHGCFTSRWKADITAPSMAHVNMVRRVSSLCENAPAMARSRTNSYNSQFGAGMTGHAERMFNIDKFSYAAVVNQEIQF
jgi:hypothetical protein